MVSPWWERDGGQRRPPVESNTQQERFGMFPYVYVVHEPPDTPGVRKIVFELSFRQPE